MSRSLSGSVPPRRWAGAGLLALVSVLISGMPARAQEPADDDAPLAPRPKRPVAIVELGDAKANRELAADLARELNNSRELKQVDSSLAASVLTEEFRDEDASAIDDALDAKRRAEDSLNTYKFPDAASYADNGLIRLQYAVPTSKVVATSAELAFLLGVAKLGQRDKTAPVYFRFARSLDPAFKPDPVRYLPEIVEAFEGANKIAPASPGYIDLQANTGRVYLDGKDLGPAPQTIDKVPPGLHLVWLTSPQHETVAKRIEVTAGQKTVADLVQPTIDERKRVLRARLDLRLAPDPAARVVRMQALARLEGIAVRDAVLLTESNGKTIVQTWRQGPVEFGTPGFSALREVKPDEKPGELLAPFLEPKKDPPPRRVDPPFNPPVVDTRHWYEKPRYQIAGGVGVVVLGLAIYALSSWSLYEKPFSNMDGKFRK